MTVGARQIGHVTAYRTAHPRALDQASKFRTQRGNELPDWPDWCYLPMAGFAAISNPDGPLDLAGALETSLGAALVPWHYTRGIYRWDAALAGALLNSPIDDELPVEVLYRLPEWSVYIEAPKALPDWPELLHGFYVHLERDMNTGGDELRLLLDTDDQLVPIPVHLGPWSVLEAIARAHAQSERLGGLHAGTLGHLTLATEGWLTPLVSLLLYLCAEGADIEDLAHPGRTPERPRPTRTKRGWRLFAPDQVTVWHVGLRVGATLEPDASGFWRGRLINDRYTYRWTSTAGGL